MRDVVLLGPPGSGKGTQARLLLESSNHFVHLSTGDVLRGEIKLGTPLGREAEAIMSRGEYLDEKLITAIVKDWVLQHEGKAVLFDGFPRTASQVDSFVGMEKALGRACHVIEMTVSSDELRNRLMRRCVCAQCGFIDQKCSLKDDKTNEWVCPTCGAGEVVVRSDDSAGVIGDRLALYDRHIESIRERLKAHNISCRAVDGSRSVLAVREDIVAALQEGSR